MLSSFPLRVESQTLGCMRIGDDQMTFFHAHVGLHTWKDVAWVARICKVQAFSRRRGCSGVHRHKRGLLPTRFDATMPLRSPC